MHGIDKARALAGCNDGRSDEGAHAATSNIFRHEGQVSRQQREERFGHCAATVWLTGLSGAGKSTIAYELEATLLAEGRACFVLDGDNMRLHLNSDLGFSAADRKENIRRAAEVARLMNEAGLVVVTSFISPFREDRALARAIVGEDRFLEVHVSTSVELCELRDPKGLYARARAGQLREFTGVSSPYEPPLSPALDLDTGKLTLAEATRALHDCLSRRFA
ncbi:adenylyl-sulfate kinase [Herbaspirillum sp. HC18]|nr:adenylyl-sulfate kinase [Herbaspirillum sp. HC18]